MEAERQRFLFSPIEGVGFAARLAEGLREMARRPAAFLRSGLFPDSFADSLLGRLFGHLGALLAHPRNYLGAALAVEPLGAPRRRLFAPILTVLALAYAGVFGYLIYQVVISPYSSLSIVSRPYKPFEDVVNVGPLYYPPQVLQAARNQQAMDLEEIRERDRRRREEAERREREEAERRRREEEKRREELARAEEAKKAEEAAKAAANERPQQLQFGEINEAPLREIVGATYAQYRAGKLDITTMNFSIMATFEIEPDGSLSQIKIVKSSGSEILDRQGRAILHAISESHALGPIAHLSSCSVRFDLTDTLARLTISGFAPTAGEAQAQADFLKVAVHFARLKQQSVNPTVAELLGMVRIKSDNKRIDAELSTSRARATEMMRQTFGGSQ